jgi:hypothetical protein
MLFPTFLCVVIVVLAFCVEVASSFTIENAAVSFTFDPSTGQLSANTDKHTSINVFGTAPQAVAQTVDYYFVGSHGELRLGELALAQGVLSQSPFESAQSNKLTLTWSNVGLFDYANTEVASVNLSLLISLDSRDATVASFTPSFTLNANTSNNTPSQQVGIWDVSVSIPSNIASDENGQLFYPSGYGFTYPNPLVSTGGSHAKTYPCGEAAMQFMSLGNAKLASGLYVGAADHTGSGKLLQFSSANGHQRPVHGKAAWRKEELDSVRTLKWSAKKDSKHVESAASSTAGPSGGAAAALSVVIYAPDSGVPLTTTSSWTSPYSLTIGVVPRVDAVSGRPLWAQAADIYRNWALAEADWTRMGPITSAHRVGEYPEWYLRTDMWLNTHWQCHDIFNRTGGDPAFVAANTGPVVDKLRTPAAQLDATQSPIALHWYEWQQGPSPAEEDRYLFDTHYPDYFPSRTSFKDAVKALKQDKNVYTFPYINGRISDINSDAYLSENGAQYCTKQAPTALVTSSTTLTPYRETYGSNATFCVTNPFTSYWQNKIADTCKQLVEDYDVAG